MAAPDGPARPMRGEREVPLYDVACVGMMAANLPVRPVSRAVFDVDVTLVEKMELTAGGDAMNEAIVLSRLGSRVLLSGKVGDDSFGRFLIETARSAGVDTAGVRVDRGVSTSTCVILISGDGSRNFLSHRHATERLSLQDIDVPLVTDARLVCIGSLLALPALDGAGAAALLEGARARGCATAADTKHDTYGTGLKGIRDALRYVDYLLPSYEEARDLSGESDPASMAEALLDTGAGCVVVKLGARGCYLRTRRASRLIDGFAAEVVDTTGAGDNFVAGFLTGVLRGWDPERCCRFANAAGAVSVTGVGATAAVKSMDQVIEYMERSGGTR